MAHIEDTLDDIIANITELGYKNPNLDNFNSNFISNVSVSELGAHNFARICCIYIVRGNSKLINIPNGEGTGSIVKEPRA